MIFLLQRTLEKSEAVHRTVHGIGTMANVDGDRCLLDDSSLPPPYSEIPGVVPLHTGRWSGPPPSYDDVVNPDGELNLFFNLFFSL